MVYFIRGYGREILLVVCLFLLPFLFPAFEVSNNVGTLVSATSTIFAIVAGFFIADAMSNYLKLQTLIAEENAALISIAIDAKHANKKYSITVNQAIDEYMIAQLESNTLNHIFQTQKQVDKLARAIHSLPINTQNSLLFDHILTMEEKIYTSRQEIALTGKKTLTYGHWITLIVLAALVIISVLAIRDGKVLTNIVLGSMMVGIFAILIVLREIDNNHFLEGKLAYDNPRDVFLAISKPPYYPYFSPVKSRVAHEGRMRVGKRH